MLWLGDVMLVMPDVCLCQVWAGELVMDWGPGLIGAWRSSCDPWLADPGWPLVIFPGHRDTGAQFPVNNIAEWTECAVSPWAMYSLRPVTLDWSLLTAYFVDGKMMIHKMASSACSHPILFQDWKRCFGPWRKHQNHLNQVSSSCIFLISTDRLSPRGRGRGELGAEAHTWNINFKQSILRNLSVIHPVKKSKIWLNNKPIRYTHSADTPTVITYHVWDISCCNPSTNWCRALPSLLTPG